MYTDVLPAFVCALHVRGAHRSEKRALDPLELELEVAVSCMLCVC